MKKKMMKNSLKMKKKKMKKMKKKKMKKMKKNSSKTKNMMKEMISVEMLMMQVKKISSMNKKLNKTKETRTLVYVKSEHYFGYHHRHNSVFCFLFYASVTHSNKSVMFF